MEQNEINHASLDIIGSLSESYIRLLSFKRYKSQFAVKNQSAQLAKNFQSQNVKKPVRKISSNLKR